MSLGIPKNRMERTDETRYTEERRKQKKYLKLCNSFLIRTIGSVMASLYHCHKSPEPQQMRSCSAGSFQIREIWENYRKKIVLLTECRRHL
jgi:hypothetical protein